MFTFGVGVEVELVESVPAAAVEHGEGLGAGGDCEGGTVVEMDLGSGADLRAATLVVAVRTDPAVVVPFLEVRACLVGRGQC